MNVPDVCTESKINKISIDSVTLCLSVCYVFALALTFNKCLNKHKTRPTLLENCKIIYLSSF